jgi:tetratricopeptide (TPR) repeat protein
MAQKNNSNSGDAFEKIEQLDLQEGLGKAAAFFETHKKVITYAGGGLLALILGAYYVWTIYLPERQREAVDLMHIAERYFENDSLTLAVKGDGNFPGFEEIVDEYGWTRAGNLAKYYLGVSYLRLGQYNEAIESLNSFNTKDPIMGSIALGCIGDAHLQLKKDQEALDYYIQAAEFKANEFTTPFYLQRAGEIAEKLRIKDKALECYEKIQREYPQSTEGQNIDRYITRAKLKS